VAVKKMMMMNLVARLEHLDVLLKRIVLMERVHIVNAIEEIDDSNFTISIMQDNVDEIVNMCAIRPYQHEKNFKNLDEKIKILLELMKIKPCVRDIDFVDNYKFQDVKQEIDRIYKGLDVLNQKKDQYLQELDQLKELRIMELLDRVDVDIGILKQSENFTVIMGTITNDNRKKLAQNYENVPAAVMHIGSFNGEEAILVVTPSALRTETDRILRSVHYKPIPLIDQYIKTPTYCIEAVDKRIQEIVRAIKEIEQESQKYKEEYGEHVARCYSRLTMEKTIAKLKGYIATTNQFFYLSGWVPKDESQVLQDVLERDLNVIIEFKEVEEVRGEIQPPTLLKNNRIVRPFETLVNMYGIPSYEELDPTTFLGISYMILFGAMFGDFGQGLVLALVGLLMIKKGMNHNYGGLLVRMGFSSSLFGFFYDSFFGYEHIISSLVGKVLGVSGRAVFFFIRPIENINTILGVSVALGIILLLISLGYSIFNKVKMKDYQEGLFGRNGVSGLILYVSLLLLVASKAGLITMGPLPLVVLSVVCVGLIVVREPLTNYISGHKNLYHEGASAYYVESGFDVLETFLSMLSNSVSFIRVGAFALNHVGLFIAFHTMAEIIGNAVGNVLMFVIGNVLIIFLEGLIVFIQGLRLVYYEMFSKYYTGSGKAFEAVRMSCIEKV
jgi:V/A-type H+-transporting ATPase subunit I